MKHILITTTILVSAVAAAATAGNASSAAAAACYSKNATIKGKSVIVACGPASAKLHYKGKTYSFKSGTCFRSGPGVEINLGITLANGNGSGGFTDMNITLLPTKTHIVQVNADDGTLHLVGAGTYSKIAVTGTFKGTNNAPASKAVTFTGSWNCGGAIYKF